MFVRDATTRSLTSRNKEITIADYMSYHELMRTERPAGTKGSLKWIQRAVTTSGHRLMTP
jgi:hypothetical protein